MMHQSFFLLHVIVGLWIGGARGIAFHDSFDISVYFIQQCSFEDQEERDVIQDDVNDQQGREQHRVQDNQRWV